MEGLSGTPLCFARTDLGRGEFSVDKFLSALRARVPIETISEDLRTYLKILQNAMIELINADYADFVNLSTNLVNLGTGLAKLDGDLASIHEEFSAASRGLETAIGQLDVHLEQKRRSGRAQNEIEDRMSLISSLSRAQKLLSNPWPQEGREVMLERTAQLLLGIRIKLERSPGALSSSSFQSAYTSTIDKYQTVLEEELTRSLGKEAGTPNRALFTAVLLGFEACNRRDAALATFIGGFLEPKLSAATPARKLSYAQKLDAVLQVLESESAHYRQALDASDDSLEWTFLNEALLTLLLSSLDTHFGPVLIPSDADAFHDCYARLSLFSNKWRSPGHRLLKLGLGKFSLPVYFRLRTVQLSERLDSALSSGLPIQAKTEGPLRLEASALLLGALEGLWSESVFLPPLLPRAWDHTLRLLAQYREWQSKVIGNASIDTSPQHTIPSVQSAPVLVANGDQDTVHVVNETERRQWETLCELVTDVAALDAALFDLAFQRIWGPVRELGGEPRSLGEALSAALGDLKLHSTKALEALHRRLGSSMRASLSTGASEIPRQYRWTRKEAPTEPSPYILSSLEPVTKFVSFAQQRSMGTEEVGRVVAGTLKHGLEGFAESVSGVIESVQKISSSLSRLKRAPKTTSGEAGLTDDQKIRKQLQLDLSEFKRGSESLLRDLSLPESTIDWSSLDTLLLQAKEEPKADS